MKVKILIVEDEVLVAEDVASDLESDGYEVTDIAISSQEALASIAKKTPHIILMDINIKGELDGIETAEQINKKVNIPIIYVTSNNSSQFVERAITTGPHAFLTKPYNYKDLLIAIEIALKSHNQKIIDDQKADLSLDSIFVKQGDFHRKVLIENILFVEADGSYCKVITKENSYVFSFNLNHFQNHVKSPILRRVHRSFIVNLSKVDGVDKSSLLINEKIIPVSNTFKEDVFKYFNRI